MKKMMIHSLVGILLSLTTLVASGSNEVKQQIFLYGWVPSLDGTLTFKVPGEPDDSVNANAIDSLDTVFMGGYEIRKGKWSFLTDLIYLKMSGDTTGLNPNVNLNLELTAKLFGFYGGYNISEIEKMDVNFIVGMRYFGLGLDITRSGVLFANGTLSASTDNYDAIVGIAGNYTIDENWYVPYQFDIGTGDSDLTWQANVSIAYRFGWGDVIATYRYIHYDKGDSLLVEDFNLYGPKLGVVFHF